MNNFFLTLTLMIAIFGIACQESKVELSASSPNNLSKVELSLEDNNVYYQVFYQNQEVIKKSLFSILNQDSINFFAGVKVTNSQTISNNSTWQRVWGKRKNVIDNYNQNTISFVNPKGENLKIILRAYDDGVAFCYQIDKDSLVIKDENFELNTLEESKFVATLWPSFRCSQEEEFLFYNNVNELNKDSIIGLPLLISNNNHWCAITNAKVVDWDFSAFKFNSNKGLINVSAKGNDNIAVKANSTKTSPWKVFMLASQEKDLIDSDIIQNLNDECQIENTDWIKPGMSAWDWWWNDGYNPDAKFKMAANEQTMKYFIDFASMNNWPYQLVDWYWYGKPHFDDNGQDVNWQVSCKQYTDTCNIENLVKYAQEKNVRLFIWANYQHIKKEMQEAFPLYQKWGVAGVKIDFMNNCDQATVNFYADVVKLAAKHQLMIDFHGAYLPTGFSRTYPNLITREGILGNENTKWSSRITSEHCLTLPFTRCLAGESDFTPGGFNNQTEEEFNNGGRNKPSPSVMCTRCFSLAELLVYESAFTVFCESPYNVIGQKGSEFLKNLPTSFDNSKVLDGKIAKYICQLRQKDSIIYLAGMTVNEKDFEISSKELGTNNFKIELYSDANDANENPKNLDYKEFSVSQDTILKIHCANNGGFVAKIYPKEN